MLLFFSEKEPCCVLKKNMTEIKIATPTDAFHAALRHNRARWSQIHARSLGQVGLLLMSSSHVTGDWADEGAAPSVQSYGLCKEAEKCLSVGLVLPLKEGGQPRGPVKGWRAQYAAEPTSADNVVPVKANDSLLTALYSATTAYQMLGATSHANHVVAVLAMEKREPLVPNNKPALYLPTALEFVRRPDWDQVEEATVMLPDPACGKLEPRPLLLRLTP